MTKIPITAEMVKTVLAEYGPTAHYVDPRLPPTHPDSMEGRLRRALDAALNPPAPPEIVVTKEMVRAGLDKLPCPWPTRMADEMPNIYRAMRKLEPKTRASTVTILEDDGWDGCGPGGA